MRNDHELILRQAQSTGLCLTSYGKSLSANGCGRSPKRFECYTVVHTARCARPSSPGSDNHRIALVVEFCEQCLRCTHGKVGFGAMDDALKRIRRSQVCLKVSKEMLDVVLGITEEANAFTRERPESRRRRNSDRHIVVSRQQHT